MVSDILLVIVTALLVVVTGLLVKATKDSKESAEKQAQANTETSVMNIYFQAENDLRKTELQYNANPNPADRGCGRKPGLR